MTERLCEDPGKEFRAVVVRDDNGRVVMMYRLNNYKSYMRLLGKTEDEIEKIISEMESDEQKM